jgi:hypothetical protein
VNFKGYTHHATKEEPQYFIKSDKTDHVAIHKGSALRLLKSLARRTGREHPESKERNLEGVSSVALHLNRLVIHCRSEQEHSKTDMAVRRAD